MPRRRSFGSVYRRRSKVVAHDGTVSHRYLPGYYLRIRRKGKKDVRRYGGPDRKTALDVLAKLQRELEREALLGERRPCEHTIQSFVDLFLKQKRKFSTPDGYDRRKSLLESAVVPALGTKKLDQVTRQDLRDMLAAHPNWSPASRNRALTAVSSLYKHAIDLDLVTENPVASMKRFREEAVPLSDPQRGSVLAHAGGASEASRSLCGTARGDTSPALWERASCGAWTSSGLDVVADLPAHLQDPNGERRHPDAT